MTKYTITATDKVGQVASADFNIVFSNLTLEVVIPELVLIAGTSITAPFKPVKVLSGKSPFVFSISPTLPTGLNFSTSGEISGLPTLATALLDYVISVTDASGILLTENVKIRVLGQPAIASISPVTGLETGGTEVTITGVNFATTNRLLIDNTAVSFTVVDDSTVKFTTAEHPVGKIGISIATTAGESALPDAFEFTPAPPFIDSISPSVGLDKGGYPVTLTGKRLDTVTDVKFGTSSAAVVSKSANSLIATAPAHPIGDITVTAINTIGTSNQIGFTYTDSTPIYSITSNPASGIFNEGQSITWTIATTNVPDNTTLYWEIIGGTSVTTSDFTQGVLKGTMTVNKNSASQTLTAANDLALEGTENFTFQVRTGSITGQIIANSAASILDTSIPPEPTITSLTPSIAWAGGGTTVIMTGTNLTGITQLFVGGTSVTFTILAANRIRFIAPSNVVGPVAVYVRTPSGTGTASLTYDYRIDGIPAFVANGISNTFTITFYDAPPNGSAVFEDITTKDTFNVSFNSSGYGLTQVWLNTPIGDHIIKVTFSDGHVQNYTVNVT